ncbi:MAG TPA: type IV pilus modification protein PilV [Luteimonas sp.]|nr:type IV pilus modification protein PilV [Luteimonas sp.]
MAHARHRDEPRSRRASAGVGLVEVLVAVTILAFGLLGIAAMQATALRNRHSAVSRSAAVVQTYAILERMRANYDEAANGGYDLASMTCAAPTASSLVTRDQRDWILALKAGLGPQACGQIVDCGSDECKIIVQWDDSRATDGADTQQLVTETRL